MDSPETRQTLNSSAANPLRIRSAMSDIAGSGELSIARVATHLGTSPRTLQRNLSRHGITYRELVDSVRREIALVLLVETNLPVHKIAQRLGYRTPSAFSRAFARWTGQAPQQLRRDRKAVGAAVSRE
jgi:AraC-like DNA-binding protein